MRIRFSAIASVFDWSGSDDDILEEDSESEHITNPDTLRKLHGVVYREECFSDYLMDSEEDRRIFESMGLSGGYLRFEYIERDNEVVAITEYQSARDLTEKEIDYLKIYTIGQWSDGIGSNFAQCYPDESGLSPQICALGEDTKVEVFP